MKPTPKQAITTTEAFRYKAAARAYAMKSPELQPAAVADYDVSDAVAGELASLIHDALVADPRFVESEIFVLREGTPEFTRAEYRERAAPRAEALKLNAAVVEIVTGILHLVPGGVAVNVSRVSRFRRTTSCETHGRGRYCDDCAETTGVIVTVGSALANVKERLVVVLAE